MGVALAHPHGHGRHPAHGQGIGIQSAVGDAILRAPAGRFHGRRGGHHARLVQGQLERLVVLVGGHLDPPGDAVGVDHRGRGAAKRLLDLAHDALAERRIVAARLGAQRGAVGYHVGGVAGAERPHVAGAAAALLLDLAMPAAAVQVGDGARRNGNGAHAPLRRGAGVAGQALHFDLHAVGAGGAHHQVGRAAAVPVEGQPRIAQERLGHALRTLQADFLLHEPAEGDRRVRQAALGDLQRRGQQRGAGGAVVGAETGSAAGRAPQGAHRAAAQHRLAADADRYRVHVARQQPPRRAAAARQLEHQVAGIPAHAGAAVDVVGGDQRGRDAGRAELPGNVPGDRGLGPALAGNRHQFHDQPPRPRQVGFRRRLGVGVRVGDAVARSHSVQPRSGRAADTGRRARN